MTNPHARFTISPDHPSLPGHFPGNPVVPGAVILAEVVAAAASWAPLARVTGLAAAKFLSPLLPAQEAAIAFTDKGAGLLAFEVSVGERRVANGTLRRGA